MTILLHILLLLAFLSSIVVTVALRQPWGPEGPVGAWVLFVFPCLFVAVLLIALASKGLLTFLPGGRVVHYAAAAGIIVALLASFFGSLDRQNVTITFLLEAVPYLVLAGCAAALHHSGVGRPAAAAILGLAALAGWGVTATGLLLSVKGSIERSAEQAQQVEARELRYEQEELAEYAKLGADPPLSQLLGFTRARNSGLRSEVCGRVSGRATLDDDLISLLDADNQNAIDYIAFVYEKPPARLAPAWGRMLELKLREWDSLQYDEYAGKWEPNLSAYFEGAMKIQRAGGDLRLQLRVWHAHLQKSKGLENLAAFVGTLL